MAWNILKRKRSWQEAANPEEARKEAAQEWALNLWNELKTAYSVYHQNVWRARLYQVGEFYIELDKQTKYWISKPPAKKWVPQPRINRFAPAIASVASNFANVPEVEAVPTPKDDEYCMEIAEVVNDLILYFIKENALRNDFKSKEDLADEAAMQFVLQGCTFTNTYTRHIPIGEREVMSMQQVGFWQCPNCDTYNTGPSADGVCPNCGTPVSESPMESMQAEMDEEGNPTMETVQEPKVCVCIDDSLWIFPRSGSTKLSNSPYVIKAHRMSIDEIYSEWGVEADPDSEYPDGFNLQYDTHLNYYYVGYNQKTNETKDGALVIEVYCEPGKVMEFPEGFYAVIINKKLHQFRNWDEAFPEHPLTMGSYEQIPGVFFPRSLSFDLCEVVKELCDYEQLIKVHGLVSAVEPIVIDENTVVNEITGDPQDIIRWRGFGANSKEPHRMKHGVLDEGVYKQREELKREIENIMSTVEVMRGKQPGSVTANVAIQTLRGQAELMYAKPVSNWAAMWKETVRKGIKNYQRFYSLDQLVSILGEDRIQQIQEFQRADLDKCLEYLATSNGLPRTRDERRQEFMELFDKGAIDFNDPGVKEKAFELFGETGAMSTFNDDARRARRNVKAMSKGMMVQFRPGIDDPGVHMGIALEAAKSLEFDRWPPEAQMLLIGYIQSIRAMVMQAEQALSTAGPGQIPPGRNAPVAGNGVGQGAAIPGAQ